LGRFKGTKMNLSRNLPKTGMLALLLVSALALEGCGQMRTLAGVGRTSPDEFRVVSKPPLVMPPDYSLRPRNIGESKPQQLTPATQVVGALFPGRTTLPPSASAGEGALVEAVGASSVSPNVRSAVGDSDTLIVEKGMLLRNVLESGEVQNSPDTSHLERVDSQPDNQSGNNN